MPDVVSLTVILPDSRHTIQVSPHDTQIPLSDVLRHAALPLNTRCGGRGLCDGCLVHLSAGSLRNPAAQIVTASDQPLRACEHRLAGGDVKVAVPQRSSLRYQPQVVSDYRINIPFSHDPICKESGALGAAIDIGTTTVALMLVDLKDGKILARTSAFNEQMRLGDDVVTRINLCTGHPELLKQLQSAIADVTIRPLLDQALAAAGAALPDVRVLSIAGNTTMLHLLAGVDPTSLGIAPFKAVFLDHRIIPAADIFADPALSADCHLLPGAAAYVGADLTAGAVATGLIYEDGPSLLVDVGTNGEIILKHGSQFLGCATAAGPAFEGARLTSGMRAGDGAISHIHITDDPFDLQIETIGHERKPVGICGSGYVDFLATAHASGVLTATGRYDRQHMPPAAADRVQDHHVHDRSFRLSGSGTQAVMISQSDVASLLQAKAAVAAGLLTLLDIANVKPADIKTLYLAGGFGTHMDRHSAIACGLLPGFKPEQIQPVGNTSLAGAYLAMMDAGLLQEIGAAGTRLRTVELNLEPMFEERFIDQLALPDPVE